MLPHHLSTKPWPGPPAQGLPRNHMAGALCPPLPPASALPGSAEVGSWSGARERKGLMKRGPQEQPLRRGKIGKIASWLFFSARLLRNTPAALCPGRSSEAPGIHLPSVFACENKVRSGALWAEMSSSCERQQWEAAFGLWEGAIRKKATCSLL